MKSRPITIACVLKHGGSYMPEDVHHLWVGVKKWVLDGNFRFVCLTDVAHAVRDEVDTSVEVLHLEHRWPGWWSKIEVFRLPAPLLYFDLDTVIVGSLSKLIDATLQTPGILMLHDFYNQMPESGIFGFRKQHGTAFYQSFLDGIPSREWGRELEVNIMGETYRRDGKWIAKTAARLDMPISFAQDQSPGIYSYKVHVQPRQTPTLKPDSRIICFHGVPRPRDLHPRPDWLSKAWEGEG